MFQVMEKKLLKFMEQKFERSKKVCKFLYLILTRKYEYIFYKKNPKEKTITIDSGKKTKRVEKVGKSKKVRKFICSKIAEMGT